MKVCLLCVEIFAWGKFGGFGRATRTIGKLLVKNNIEVFAIVPRRGNQTRLENLDGIQVYSFPKTAPWMALQLMKELNIDIFHSQEPSLLTYLAQQAAPLKKHVVTCRDTRTAGDWKIERSEPSLSVLQVVSNQIFEDNVFVHKAVRNAHAVVCAAEFLSKKAQVHYQLPNAPALLPTPVELGNSIQKSEIPTVCLLSRWDRRKRPEIFFKLAEKFPEVQFIAVGKSRDEKYDKYLRIQYRNLSNLEMTGFLDQFQSGSVSGVLSKSWILINTALREGLPNAYIEAVAHQCAILSAVDPDHFASKFGFHAKNDNFAEGLRSLLTNRQWEKKGLAGYKYVGHVYEENAAIQQHIAMYNQLMGDRD